VELIRDADGNHLENCFFLPSSPAGIFSFDVEVENSGGSNWKASQTSEDNHFNIGTNHVGGIPSPDRDYYPESRGQPTNLNGADLVPNEKFSFHMDIDPRKCLCRMVKNKDPCTFRSGTAQIQMVCEGKAWFGEVFNVRVFRHTKLVSTTAQALMHEFLLDMCDFFWQELSQVSDFTKPSEFRIVYGILVSLKLLKDEWLQYSSATEAISRGFLLECLECCHYFPNFVLQACLDLLEIVYGTFPKHFCAWSVLRVEVALSLISKLKSAAAKATADKAAAIHDKIMPDLPQVSTTLQSMTESYEYTHDEISRSAFLSSVSAGIFGALLNPISTTKLSELTVYVLAPYCLYFSRDVFLSTLSSGIFVAVLSPIKSSKLSSLAVNVLVPYAITTFIRWQRTDQRRSSRNPAVGQSRLRNLVLAHLFGFACNWAPELIDGILGYFKNPLSSSVVNSSLKSTLTIAAGQKVFSTRNPMPPILGVAGNLASSLFSSAFFFAGAMEIQKQKVSQPPSNSTAPPFELDKIAAICSFHAYEFWKTVENTGRTPSLRSIEASLNVIFQKFDLPVSCTLRFASEHMFLGFADVTVVAPNENKRLAIVAFRGTKNNAEFLKVDVFPGLTIPERKLLDSERFLEVAGSSVKLRFSALARPKDCDWIGSAYDFYSYYQKCCPDPQNGLAAYLENFFDGDNIDLWLITGHSLGGACAQLLAAELFLVPPFNNNQKLSKDQFEEYLRSEHYCITFGSPVVLSDSFSALVAATKLNDCYRHFSYKNDPVPWSLPLLVRTNQKAKNMVSTKIATFFRDYCWQKTARFSEMARRISRFGVMPSFSHPGLCFKLTDTSVGPILILDCVAHGNSVCKNYEIGDHSMINYLNALM
jgi:hypothetical protein